jgi:hypothetical protein
MRSRRLSLGGALVALVASCAEAQVATDDIPAVEVGDELAPVKDAVIEISTPIDVTDDTGARDVTASTDVVVDTGDDVNDAGVSDTSVTDVPASDAPAADVVVADASMDAAMPPIDAGPLGDSLPTGAVMFFTTRACPLGWEPFSDAAGRVAVAMQRDAPVGTRFGTPLSDGEDRAHTHTLSESFNVLEVSYAGIVGCCNDNLGAANSAASFTTTSAASTTGLPYVQMLVCRKTGMAYAHTSPLPSGMMVFFTGTRCPEGFSQPAMSQGRVPIGLVPGGTANAVFGGAPLGATDVAAHTHEVNAPLTTTSHGIALGSGCCGSGYARHGMYFSTRPTMPAQVSVPTIQLLQCMKD